ncbi:MAG: hypothetical protein LBS40_07920 [Burkholderiales bacterium]|nr:hypothetical protein [Burkholderiales bacterium]
MLLEALISILLFALGIVALVGLQGHSIATTGDVQYRAEAVQLANAYAAKIWGAQNNAVALQTQFETDGTEYNTFRDQVIGANGFQGIPGAQPPTVTITPNVLVTPLLAGGTMVVDGVIVTIQIQWVDKNNPAITHDYTHVTEIGFQPTNGIPLPPIP